MLRIVMASFCHQPPTIALLVAATLFAASNSRAAAPANPDNRAEGSADDHHYWQWGMGFYYPGIIGRWTELDAARADWLLLRFTDLAPSKETSVFLFASYLAGIVPCPSVRARTETVKTTQPPVP